MSIQEKAKHKKPLDDEKIIDLYWKRDEKAIDETDFKYKNYLFVIAYNILNNPLDCEECLNDTYLGAWYAMPPSRPDVLKAFLTIIRECFSLNTKFPLMFLKIWGAINEEFELSENWIFC